MVETLNLGPQPAGGEALSRRRGLGLEVAGAPRRRPSLGLRLARTISLGPESARADAPGQKMVGAPSRRLGSVHESAGARSQWPSLGHEWV